MNRNFIIYGILILVSVYIILNLSKKGKKETFYIAPAIANLYSTNDAGLCNLDTDTTVSSDGRIYEKNDHRVKDSDEIIYGQSKKVKLYNTYCNRKVSKKDMDSLQKLVIDEEMFARKIYIDGELKDGAQLNYNNTPISNENPTSDTLHGIVIINKKRYTQFAYIFWIKIEDISDKDRIIIARGSRDSPKPVFQILKKTTSLKIGLNAKEITLASGDISLNKWTQVCVSLNGNEMDIYIDSLLRNKGKFENEISTNNDTPLWINPDNATGILLKKLKVMPISVSHNYVKYILGHNLQQNDSENNTKYERCISSGLKKLKVPINENWGYIPEKNNSNEKNYVGLIQSQHGLCLQNNGNDIGLAKCDYSDNINQKWFPHNKQMISKIDNNCLTINNDQLILEACDPNNANQRNDIISKLISMTGNINTTCRKYKTTTIKKYPILVNSSPLLDIHRETTEKYINYNTSGINAISEPTQVLMNNIVFLNGLVVKPSGPILALLTPKYKPPSGQLIFMGHDDRDINGEQKDTHETLIKKTSNLAITNNGNIKVLDGNNNITQLYTLDNISYPLGGNIENLVYTLDRRCLFIRIFKMGNTSLDLDGIEIYNNNNKVIKENLNISYSHKSNAASAKHWGSALKLSPVPKQLDPFILINFKFAQVISSVILYNKADVSLRDQVKGTFIQLLDYNRDIIDEKQWISRAIDLQGVGITNMSSTPSGEWNTTRVDTKKCTKWNEKTPYAAIHGIEGKYGTTSNSYRDGIHNYQFTDVNNNIISDVIGERVMSKNTASPFRINKGISDKGQDFAFNCADKGNPINSFKYNTNERVSEGFIGNGTTEHFADGPTEHFANKCDSTLEECCNKFTRGAFAGGPGGCQALPFGNSHGLARHGDGDNYKRAYADLKPGYICPPMTDKSNWFGCHPNCGNQYPDKFKIKTITHKPRPGWGLDWSTRPPRWKRTGMRSRTIAYANRTDAKNYGWGMNLHAMCCKDPGVCTDKPDFLNRLAGLQALASKLGSKVAGDGNMKVLFRDINKLQRIQANKYKVKLHYLSIGPNLGAVNYNQSQIDAASAKIIKIKRLINTYNTAAKKSLLKDKYSITNFDNFYDYTVLTRIHRDLDSWVLENKKKLGYRPKSNEIANLDSLKNNVGVLKNKNIELQKTAKNLGINKVHIETFKNIGEYSSNPFIEGVIDEVSNLDKTMSNLENIGSIRCADDSESKFNNLSYVVREPSANSDKISIKNYANHGPANEHLSGNMCRNPGKPRNITSAKWTEDDKLWCYTNQNGTEWDYCRIDGQTIPHLIKGNTQPLTQTFKFYMRVGPSPTGFTDVIEDDLIIYQRGFSSLNNQIVHIGGSIKTLPSTMFLELKTIARVVHKFRPKTRKIFNVSVGGNIGRVDVLPNGSVIYVGPEKTLDGAFIKKTSLSGIRYTIENGKAIELSPYYEPNTNDTIIYRGFSKAVVYGAPSVILIGNIVSLSGVLKFREEFLKSHFKSEFKTLGILDNDYWPSRNLIFNTNQGTQAVQIKITMNGIIEASNIIMSQLITLDGIMYVL